MLEKVAALHRRLRGGEAPESVFRPETYLSEITEEEFLYSKSSWEFITDSYLKYARDYPFINYFWTIRNIHIPIWKVSRIIEELPRTAIVHSPSTGYVGFISSLISGMWNAPFILTEHGIYTRERKIDILLSDILQEEKFFFQREYGETGYIKSSG